MKLTAKKCGYLVAMLFVSTMSFTTSSQADTRRLVIESGDSALTRQQAAMEKEQWDDTRSLRHKINRRAEKEWDKDDVAFDAKDDCNKSSNINAYWEPNTRRCLNRQTGRVITP